MARLLLTKSLLLYGRLREKDTGGHSVFLGQVRADVINGKTVKAIEYSAYESMVNSEADKIKADSIIMSFQMLRIS